MTIAGAIARAADCGTRLAGCLRTDARLLVRAAAWRIVLPILKRALPLPALVRLMHAGRTMQDPGRRRDRLASVHHLLAHGGRLVVSRNCLERSLLMYRFLSEVDARPLLVMAVNRANPADGHAWIEVDGTPLADSTTARFTPVLVFGEGGAVQPFGGECARA